MFVPASALLNPSVDIIFRMLFADADDTVGLQSLLGALLYQLPVFHVHVMTPNPLPSRLGGKEPRFDILVEVNHQIFVNLEMQNRWHESQYPRGLFYWATIFQVQMDSGQDHDYMKLKPVRCIFLGPDQLRRFTDDPAMRHRIRAAFVDRPDAEQTTPECFGIDYIDLKKAIQLGSEKVENVAGYFWAKFLINPADSAVEEFAMTDLGMERTLNKLKTLSNDDDIWEKARLRMDEAHHRFNQLDAKNEGIREGLEHGIEKGRREGLEEGMEKGRRETIILLLSLPGFASASAEVIAARTNFDLDFVRKVLAELAENPVASSP